MAKQQAGLPGDDFITTSVLDRFRNIPRDLGRFVINPAGGGREVPEWWTRMQEPERRSLMLAGKIGIGTLGLGGLAAIMLHRNRAAEQELLDEEKARAEMKLPVLYGQKGAGVSSGKEAALSPESREGLGQLKDELFDFAGQAWGPVKDKAKGLASKAWKALTWNGPTFYEKQEHAIDPSSGTGFTDLLGQMGTMIHENHWALPAWVAAGGLGLGGGYLGLGHLLAKRRTEAIKRRRDESKRKFEEALLNEQNSKLGSALEEYVSACEEAAPSLKEKTADTSWYERWIQNPALNVALAVALAAGTAGAYHGYKQGPHKLKYDEMKKVRDKQLALRRLEELSVLPEDPFDEE
jgi:hypothetical protein